ncbi:ABC transporter permease [Yoonia vestfoldensis]|uniref:Glutathione transport system permease protein GsiD n=1 Tax=Yoonia vestfoldensis TaxID=245188 RepID=A0A1Y0ECC5_9RHOB|nr:glutathione transport system permease protein GsiD [Yoonia vestfoldensis]
MKNITRSPMGMPEPIGVTPAHVADGYWRGVIGRLMQDRLTVLSCGILLIMLIVIVFAPVFAPYSPIDGSIARRLRPVGTPGHLLGTDELGRDMLSRMIYGGRFSWFIGITPVALALVIGGGLGIIAGFFGGTTNMVIMRVTDVFYAFPSVLLAVAISGALGAGLGNTILSLTIVFIPPIIRVAESVTTGVRNLDYIEAARASGASASSLVRIQVLPNVLGPIFVYATGLVSISMIIASGLSFLGLGVTPPNAEWGLMLNTLRSAIYSQPLIASLPGLCIFVTSICFNLASDGLRTAMDVRA